MIYIRFFIFQVELFLSLLQNFYIYLELRQKNEDKILDVDSYVQIIKDALYLNKSVCLARNFPDLQKEDMDSTKQKVFIDIWPVCLIIIIKKKKEK